LAAIKRREHTLIAAPTGSGKTLSAFLSAIDDLVWKAVDGKLVDETQVVYVSPLKALSNDIQINLQEPLRGIQQNLEAMGIRGVEIRTLVRTGDTPQKDRAAMIKKAPAHHRHHAGVSLHPADQRRRPPNSQHDPHADRRRDSRDGR